MDTLNMSLDNSISRYIKQPREKTLFYRSAIFFVFALYVMPQYFGIPNPVFDITIVRIAIVILLLFIISDYTRLKAFIDIILHERISLVLMPYLFVILYTMVLRVDINAFLNPFIEILEMYLLIYVIKDSIGVDRTIKLIQCFIYMLVFLGFVEMVIQRSPFSYLETIKGLSTGRFIRGGHYRIMSSCIHSIGYGLLLVTAMPFVGLDVNNKTYDAFRRPFLLMGTVINIFATGSRSTLGILFAELFLMLLLSDREFHKKNILLVLSFLVGFTLFTIAFQKTSFGQYILLQLTSLSDTLFGTELADKYGANSTQLGQSASYRNLLKQVFHVSWLNPFLGIGRKRAFSAEINGLVVQSIDNFYIAEYIRYAYPGMLSYIFFIGFMGISIFRDMYRTHSATIRMLFIGVFSYCAHLYIADSLQTLKYLYVLLALYVCCDKTPYVPEGKNRYFEKRKSKYVKKY